MKVLIPYFMIHGDNTLDSPIVLGGIDKFIHSIYTYYDGAEIIPFYYNESDRDARIVTKKLIQSLAEHNPDLLLVNYDTPSLITNIAMASNIPVLWITHNCAGGIGRLGQVELMHEFETNGGTLAMVSQFQSVGMQALARRMIGADLQLRGGFISPAFSFGHEPVAEQMTNDLISIGRCNLSKSPFMAHSLAARSNYRSIVHTNLVAMGERDRAYHERYVGLTSDMHQTHYAASHARVMSDLGSSAVLVSSHPAESWGIVVFEALVRGVPVLQKTDRTMRHAADEITPDSTFLYKFSGQLSKDDTERVVDRCRRMRYTQRVEIAQRTQEKHSLTNWKARLSSMFDATLEAAKKAKGRSLEQFMV
jgi:hypothetical protein